MTIRDFLFFVFLCAFFFVPLYLTRATDEDIKLCVEKTGWSPARCKVELER